jgi:hypothetical protein
MKSKGKQTGKDVTKITLMTGKNETTLEKK